MVTDTELRQSLEQDPFHQDTQTSLGFDQVDAVIDILQQVFPNATTEPSGVWTIPAPRSKARATFRPGSTRAVTRG